MRYFDYVGVEKQNSKDRYHSAILTWYTHWVWSTKRGCGHRQFSINCSMRWLKDQFKRLDLSRRRADPDELQVRNLIKVSGLIATTIHELYLYISLGDIEYYPRKTGARISLYLYNCAG